jgi:hypothetical protein
MPFFMDWGTFYFVIEKYFNFYSNTLIHLVHQQELQVRDRQLITYPQMIDVAFFGKPNTVSISTQMYTFFDRYLKDYNRILPKSVEIPELAWRQYLGERGIISLYFRFGYVVRRTLGKGDISFALSSARKITLSADRRRLSKALMIMFLKLTLMIINRITLGRFKKVLERFSIHLSRAASYLSQRN